MKKISGNPNIQFAVNDDMTGSRRFPPAASATTANPACSVPFHGNTQTDAQLNFTGEEMLCLPNSIVSWKGTLTPPHDGDYWIYLQALGTNASISIDGKRLAATGAFQGGVHGDILQANQDNVVPTPTASTMCAVPFNSPPARMPSKSKPVPTLLALQCRFA